MSSWTTSSPQEFVEHVQCHKVTRLQRTCLWQPWMCQLLFVKGARPGSGSCPWVRATWGYSFSPTTVRSSRCQQQNSNAWLVHGLRIAWEEAVWCSSVTHSLEATITVSDTVITRRSREHGFKALGAWITFDSHFVKEIAERELIAWRSFYAIRNLLCDNKVALRHLLRLLSSCVASSMYWCSGS